MKRRNFIQSFSAFAAGAFLLPQMATSKTCYHTPIQGYVRITLWDHHTDEFLHAGDYPLIEVEPGTWAAMVGDVCCLIDRYCVTINWTAQYENAVHHGAPYSLQAGDTFQLVLRMGMSYV